MDNDTNQFNNNPYKGLCSYYEEDKDIFYGRNKEIGELHNLINLNFLILVFGKSGIGKTSLLNAGLIPILSTNGFIPFYIRLGYSENRGPLLEQIHTIIHDKILKSKVILKSIKKGKKVSHIKADESLWEYFHRVEHVKEKSLIPDIPVLIFDQFEEFFTLGKFHKDKDKLLKELYWLIENQIPDSFDKKRVIDYKTPKIRIIISFREEYLPHFIDLKEKISSIDAIKYRINYLNGYQAKMIISQPGNGIKDTDVINDIIGYLTPVDRLSNSNNLKYYENLEIEPVLLSLLCHQIYEKNLKLFSKNDPNIIFKNFYTITMKNFSVEVTEWIEENLLTEAGYRNHSFLEPNHKLRTEIEKLVEKRILRIFFIDQKEYVEIIHDVLAPIVKEKRQLRLDIIEKQKEKEKKKKKYFISISILLLIILAISVKVIFLISKQKEVSNINFLIAEALLTSYSDNTKAIRIVEKAFIKGRSDPPARIYRSLSEIGYSSFNRPFYIADLKHNGSITIARFSPAESKILTASEDGNIKFWSQDGKSLFELKEHLSRITQISFSTDGNKALIASADGTAKLLNLKDQSIKIFQHHGVVSSAVFSPQGGSVLTGSWDKTAKLWNLEGKLLQNINGHNQALSSAVFSPDGKFILTASWDRTASVWDLNGKKIANMIHDSGLSSAQFFPDGKTILSASDDGMIKVWNLTGKVLFERKHNSIISAFAISPDGKNYCVSSEDGFCRIWNSDQQKWKLASEWKQDGVATKIEFSRDNNRIIMASSDGKARIYKINGELQAVLPHTKAVLSANFSVNGTLAVTSSEDGSTKIWELKNDLVSVIEPNIGEVSQALYSPSGEIILVAFRNSPIVQLLNIEGKLLKEYRTSEGRVSSIAFSQDSQMILLGSTDGKLKLYGNNSKLETNFSEDFASSALFTPDGKKILMNLSSGKSVIWSLLDNSKKNLEHDNPISISSISAQGEKVLTISDDMIAKIWDIKGVELNRVRIGGKVLNAFYSGDGKLFRVIFENGKINELTINGQPGKEIMLIEQPIRSAIFSPNGERILLGMEDGRSLLYSIDGRLLGESKLRTTPIVYGSYSPDGMKFITVSMDVAIIQSTPEGILKWLKNTHIQNLSEECMKKLEIE